MLPWVALDIIDRPKEWGGWGIKDIQPFASSLASKSRWRLLTEDNLWIVVVKRKYIVPTPF